jgi:hypothetical protein
MNVFKCFPSFSSGYFRPHVTKSSSCEETHFTSIWFIDVRTDKWDNIYIKIIRNENEHYKHTITNQACKTEKCLCPKGYLFY